MGRASRAVVRAVDGDGVHALQCKTKPPCRYPDNSLDKATLVNTTQPSAPVSSPRTIRGEREEGSTYQRTDRQAGMRQWIRHSARLAGVQSHGFPSHETKSERPATSPCCRRGSRICHAGWKGLCPLMRAVSSPPSQHKYEYTANGAS